MGFENEMNEEGEGHSARQRDAQLQEAAEWLAQWKSGTVDEPAFERWRADPAHELAFARAANAWQAAADSAQAPEPEAATPSHFTRRRLMQGGMAGAALLAGGGGAFFATSAYAWESASTKIGETRKLRLPDDSIIAMNTDSRLYWRISRTKREFWLDRGEVAIDLHAGPDARLRTDADTAQISAGRYNARLEAAALDLLVLRGRATALSKSGQPVTATAFHRLSFGEGGVALAAASGAGLDAVLAWQNGEIMFLDTPLAQAAAEYNRYLTHKIVIDDPALAATPVAGRFLSSDPGDFLRAISAGLGVRVRTTETGYHVGK